MQASIQRIERLDSIEGADRIERATVLGWGVVVKKGDFKPGDLCVFVEIDSVLPEGPEWSEFMRQRKFRVKTAKLRGCLSQGLVFSTSIVDPEIPVLDVGMEVSAVLGITHYVKPEAGGVIGGRSAGPFPPVPKTDEPRLQSYPGLLNDLVGNAFYVTVKIDGTSGTFARMHAPYGPYRQGDLVVCTRTRSICRPETSGNAFWSVVDKYRLTEVIPEGFAVQGEVCGPKIQKNRLELTEHDLFVFDVFDMRDGRYLNYSEMVDFCLLAGLRVVPVVGCYPAPTTQLSADGFLVLAEGHYDGTKNRREGIVVRPLVEKRSEALGGARLSFKVVSNTYLLNDEE
jgi:RNA ligase (TIGR02306 family)